MTEAKKTEKLFVNFEFEDFMEYVELESSQLQQWENFFAQHKHDHFEIKLTCRGDPADLIEPELFWDEIANGNILSKLVSFRSVYLPLETYISKEKPTTKNADKVRRLEEDAAKGYIRHYQENEDIKSKFLNFVKCTEQEYN